jgi:hypothetical protein
VAERLHVGVGQFPADLKFYWLHFEVVADEAASPPEALLAVPQHTRVSEPQYIISCSGNSYASRKIFIVAWRWS